MLQRYIQPNNGMRLFFLKKLDYFPSELLQVRNSDDELEQKESNEAVSAMSDPTHTFGTISTVLMQYK